jgi:hypothetical protein
MNCDELPNICKNCIHLDSDYSEYTDTIGFYCRLCLWWPKKDSCKKSLDIHCANTRVLNKLAMHEID